jgi:hypothetical protein
VYLIVYSISKSALFAADAIRFFGEADLRDVVMTKKGRFSGVCVHRF